MKVLTARIVKFSYIKDFESLLIYTYFHLPICPLKNLTTLGEDTELYISKNVHTKYRVDEIQTLNERYKNNNGNIIITNVGSKAFVEISEKVQFEVDVFTKFIYPMYKKEEINLFGFDMIERKLSAFLNFKGFKMICIHGPSGCGKSFFLNKLETIYEWKHFIYPKFDKICDKNSLDKLINYVRMLKKNIVVCVPCLDIVKKEDQHHLAMILRKFKNIDVKVIISCNDPIELDNDISDLDCTAYMPVKLISGEDKVHYINYLLQEKYCIKVNQKDLETFSKSLHGYSCHDIYFFLKKASQSSQLMTLEFLKEFKKTKRYQPQNLINTISDIEQLKWSDIGGYDHVKRAMIEDIQEPIIKGGRMSKGILLHGPPGCSKTMFARALATECELNTFIINPSSIMRGFVGESEAALHHILQLATASAPSIIIIDEIDGIFKKRGESNESEVSGRLLSELLTFLDGVDNSPDNRVILMGITNVIDKLDEALTRPGRIDLLIKIDLPDQGSRESILKIVFSDNSFEVDVRVIESIPKLATILSGKSGADIVDAGRQLKQLAEDGSDRPLLSMELVTRFFELTDDRDLSQQFAEIRL